MEIWRLIPWAVKYGDNPEDVFERFREHRRIGLGWSLVGNLAIRHPVSAAEIAELIRQVEDYGPLHNSGQGGRCLWALYHEMRDGDLVILAFNSKRQAVVTVRDEYCYEEDNCLIEEDLYHRRVVEWTHIDAEALWNQHREPAPTWSLRWPLVKLA